MLSTPTCKRDVPPDSPVEGTIEVSPSIVCRVCELSRLAVIASCRDIHRVLLVHDETLVASPPETVESLSKRLCSSLTLYLLNDA